MWPALTAVGTTLAMVMAIALIVVTSTLDVLTAGLPIADAQFSDRLQMNAYLERIVERVQSLPGVALVALTDALPMHWPPYGTFFQIAGQPEVDRAKRPI